MSGIAIGAVLALGAALWVVAPLLTRSSEGRPACPACGPRPEERAQYCSSCGRPLRADAEA